MGKKKKNKKNKHDNDEIDFSSLDLDPKIVATLENINKFKNGARTYCIPDGKPVKEIKKAIKCIDKMLRKYIRGEIELFTPEYYQFIDSDRDLYE